MGETTAEEDFPPEGLNLHKPSVARVYDYMLGGTASWAIDRDFGERALRAFPQARPIAQHNRHFLFRVVRHLMRRGVRQFVDIGAGIPTMEATHHVADGFQPGAARVVYVDNEPVAVAESQILLERHGDPERHIAINADLRGPRKLWDRVLETGLIEPDEPIALLLIAVLHVQQPDSTGRDIGAEVVAQYRELLPAGSYLAISHGTDDGVGADRATQLAEIKQLYDKAGNPVIWRSREQIGELFGDFDLLDPGLTWVPDWHPEEHGYPGPVPTLASPNHSVVYGGVGRKP